MDVNSKKRLVGVIHHLTIGGAERMMVMLLNYFVTEGFEVHLIIFNHHGELKEQLSQEIHVHNLAIPSVSKGMFKCLKEIHHINPHFVFSGIGHLNIALAPFIPMMQYLIPQSKWIARETNIVSLQNQASKYPKLFDWLYQRFYKNYDVIIAQSEDMKNDLEKNYFSSSKIVIVNNPVDIERVEQLSQESCSYSFKEETINLLTVSGLREEKRHDLMLHTLALLPQQYHLTIVGGGEEEVSLKNLAKALNLTDRVTFEGNQLNPYNYMKNADLFLLTSQREGFPNVLIEANALGIPIVAFACPGGITEIIEEGVNGFYVPYNEIELLAKKIEKASSFSFKKESIQKRTKNRYSKEVIFQKYKRIFTEERV